MKRLVFCLTVVFLQWQGYCCAGELVNKQEQILTFWFGKLQAPDQWNTEKQKKWFRKNPEFDQQIRETFAKDIEKSSLENWKNTSHGYLAQILLFDQFPRNIFRKDKKTYAFDKKALNLALEGIKKGFDKKLFPIERQFFYMPLMHSEDIKMQNLSLKLFERLALEAPDSNKKYFENVLSYAKHHHGIVQKFGRFPHRNAILQRESTPEEIQFLEEGGFSY